MDINILSVTTLEQRRSEFEQSWIKQLSYLIPDSDVIAFGDAWDKTVDEIRRLEAILKTN